MTNSRYVRTLKDLKGVARKIAEDNMFRHNPPFLQAQMKYTVKDDQIIKQPPIVEGDRVQVISGPDKGKIGKVHSIYKDGNCCFVEGVGGSTKMVLPRTMWLEGQSKPVAHVPNPISYDNLRVVSQFKKADGSIEDVAIHSIMFRGSFYDHDRNKIMPIRRARHDPSIIVPYPVPPNPVEESKTDIATSSEVVEERTFFPPSITQSPIKPQALDQIRNPYSKFNRHKKSRKITGLEAEFWTAPEMPVPPQTKKLAKELQQMPPRKTVEFTEEIESFINSEIQNGLQKRHEQQTQALKDYN